MRRAMHDRLCHRAAPVSPCCLNAQQHPVQRQRCVFFFGFFFFNIYFLYTCEGGRNWHLQHLQGSFCRWKLQPSPRCSRSPVHGMCGEEQWSSKPAIKQSLLLYSKKYLINYKKSTEYTQSKISTLPSCTLQPLKKNNNYVMDRVEGVCTHSCTTVVINNPVLFLCSLVCGDFLQTACLCTIMLMWSVHFRVT